jgi:large-conductance mechanosensitive channel
VFCKAHRLPHYPFCFCPALHGSSRVSRYWNFCKPTLTPPPPVELSLTCSRDTRVIIFLQHFNNSVKKKTIVLKLLLILNKNMPEEIKDEERIKQKQTFGQELIAFLKEYSVIGMAIGVIVAQISKDLVDAVVKGVFTPFINLIVPGNKINNLSFVVNGVKFDIGIIVNSLLTFLIVMIALYIIVKKILKRDDLLKNK